MEEMHLPQTDHDVLIRLDTKLNFVTDLVQKTSRDLQTKAEMREVQEMHTTINNFKTELREEFKQYIATTVNPIIEDAKLFNNRLVQVEKVANVFQRYTFIALGGAGVLVALFKAVDYVLKFIVK